MTPPPFLHDGIWVEHTPDDRWYVTMNARRVLEIHDDTTLAHLETATLPDDEDEYDSLPMRDPNSHVGKLIRKGNSPTLTIKAGGERNEIDLPDHHTIAFDLIKYDIRDHLKPCPTPSRS